MSAGALWPLRVDSGDDEKERWVGCGCIRADVSRTHHHHLHVSEEPRRVVACDNRDCPLPQEIP